MAFQASDDVTVIPDNTTDRTGEASRVCLDGTEASIAVIDGDYDDMQGILDELEIDFDVIDNPTSLFRDLDEMSEYDILFVECPASPPWDDDDDSMARNLRRFVRQGHSLYVSDLSKTFIEDTLSDPQNMVFAYGTGAGSVEADILSDDFREQWGSDTIEVNFVFGGWARVVAPGPDATVFFEGDVGNDQEGPLMVRYDDPAGDGRALFTSFHSSEQASAEIQDIFAYVIFQL